MCDMSTLRVLGLCVAVGAACTDALSASSYDSILGPNPAAVEFSLPCVFPPAWGFPVVPHPLCASGSNLCT